MVSIFFRYSDFYFGVALLHSTQTFALSSCGRLFIFAAPGFGFGTSDPGYIIAEKIPFWRYIAAL